MKSEITTPAKAKELAYPHLRREKNNGLIVLFSTHGKGTVVHPDAHWPLGERSESWNMPRFEPFDGTVTLSND